MLRLCLALASVSFVCGQPDPLGWKTTPAPTDCNAKESDTGRGACHAGGNTYRALPGCRSFTQESSNTAPRKIDCPDGQLFDTTLCVCNHANAVSCASGCGSVPESPTTPTQSCACPASAESSEQEAVHLRLLVRKLLGRTTVEEDPGERTVDIVIRLSRKNLSSLWKFILLDGADGLEDATNTLVDAIAAGQVSGLPGFDMPSTSFEWTQYIVKTPLVGLLATVFFASLLAAVIFFTCPSGNRVPLPSAEAVQQQQSAPRDATALQQSAAEAEEVHRQYKLARERHRQEMMERDRKQAEEQLELAKLVADANTKWQSNLASVAMVSTASNGAWQQVFELGPRVAEVKEAVDRHHDDILSAIERVLVRPAPQTLDATRQTRDDEASGSIPCGKPVQEGACSKDDAADWRNSRLDHASLIVANLDASVKFYKKLGVVADGLERSKRTLHFGDQRVYLIERSPGSNQLPMQCCSSIGLIVEEPPSQTLSHLQRLDIRIEPRDTRTDRALGEAHSILVKDPDGHLVELVHCAPRT